MELGLNPGLWVRPQVLYPPEQVDFFCSCSISKQIEACRSSLKMILGVILLEMLFIKCLGVFFNKTSF